MLCVCERILNITKVVAKLRMATSTNECLNAFDRRKIKVPFDAVVAVVVTVLTVLSVSVVGVDAVDCDSVAIVVVVAVSTTHTEYLNYSQRWILTIMLSSCAVEEPFFMWLILTAV